jgi:hypothetical protein
MPVDATYVASNPPISINLSSMTSTINKIIDVLAQYIPQFIFFLVLLNVAKYVVNEFGELYSEAINILG